MKFLGRVSAQWDDIAEKDWATPGLVYAESTAGVTVYLIGNNHLIIIITFKLMNFLLK